MNEGFTQAVDPDSLGVSRGAKIGSDTISVLANGLENHGTLREYLSSRHAKEFIDSLISDGALDKTRLTAVFKNGELTKEGKTEIERMVRGIVVNQKDGYSLVESLPPSLINSLDKSLPSLIKLRERGAEWDITPEFMLALKHVAKFKKSNENSLEIYFSRKEMFGEIEGKNNRVVQLLSYALNDMGHEQLGKAMAAYSRMASAGQKSVKALHWLS